MRQFFLASLLMLILSACSPSKETESTKEPPQEKEYEYVLTVKEHIDMFKDSTYDKAPQKIIATSDTAAVAIGFRNFCIEEAIVSHEAVNGPTDKPWPIRFKIYDDKGADITLSVFSQNEEERKIIDARMKRIKDEVNKRFESIK